jgi:hypothetical protein
MKKLYWIVPLLLLALFGAQKEISACAQSATPSPAATACVTKTATATLYQFATVVFKTPTNGPLPTIANKTATPGPTSGTPGTPGTPTKTATVTPTGIAGGLKCATNANTYGNITCSVLPSGVVRVTYSISDYPGYSLEYAPQVQATTYPGTLYYHVSFTGINPLYVYHCNYSVNPPCANLAYTMKMNMSTRGLLMDTAGTTPWGPGTIDEYGSFALTYNNRNIDFSITWGGNYSNNSNTHYTALGYVDYSFMPFPATATPTMAGTSTPNPNICGGDSPIGCTGDACINIPNPIPIGCQQILAGAHIDFSWANAPIRLVWGDFVGFDAFDFPGVELCLFTQAIGIVFMGITAVDILAIFGGLVLVAMISKEIRS